MALQCGIHLSIAYIGFFSNFVIMAKIRHLKCGPGDFISNLHKIYMYTDHPHVFLHVESNAVKFKSLKWLENGQNPIFYHFFKGFGT